MDQKEDDTKQVLKEMVGEFLTQIIGLRAALKEKDAEIAALKKGETDGR
jgi:cytochrome oxidase Cu insertion factor (SCO1/SenC/PrrC family)